jgi:uncharacterized protein with PQ loop repeat
MYKFALPIVAGMVSTAALLPQLWLLYRTKSAEDLSYNFLYAVLVAKMLWFVHAILDSSHIFAVFLVVDAAIFSAILYLKSKYDTEGGAKLPP